MQRLIPKQPVWVDATLRAAGFFGMLLGIFACQTPKSSAVQANGAAPTYLVRVERGDTLASIAAKYDTTWEKLASLNRLAGGKAPQIGGVIRVQPGPGGRLAEGESGFLYGSNNAKRPRNIVARLPSNVKASNVGQGGNINTNQNTNGMREEDLSSSGTRMPKNAANAATKTTRGGLLFGGERSVNASGLDWPLYGELSSGFGLRHGHWHQGIDIRAKKGTPVVAAGDGVVEFVGKQHGYGRMIIVQHQKYKTAYAHLSSVDVRSGQKIAKGSTIGTTGLSGNSTGPHLHFEVRTLADRAIDPLLVLERDKLVAAGGRVSRSGE